MQGTPILLTKRQLVSPVDAAIAKLDEIAANAPPEHSGELLREGLFVLAVSTVEVMLSDTLFELLRRMPAKLPDKQFSVSKETLLQKPFELVEEQVQMFLTALSYKSLRDLLRFVEEHLAEIGAFREERGNDLQEIKESRNLLLHNNLIPNPIYLEKAGPKIRRPARGSRLSIDGQYFSGSVATLRELCVAVQQGIDSRYSGYTRVAAIRRLWEYVFQTPIMSFDRHWEINEEKDEVFAQKTGKFPGLCHSEKVFLGVWLTHFNGGSGHPDAEGFSMHGLDSWNQKKMLWLVSTLRSFRLY